MNHLRIAILIFFVGASVANVLAAKLQHDQLRYPTASAAASPRPSMKPGEEFPALNALDLEMGDPNKSRYELKLQVLVNDKAYLREAVIVTIAGVAWFLIRPRPI